jgi:subtilisin family serine protease
MLIVLMPVLLLGMSLYKPVQAVHDDVIPNQLLAEAERQGDVRVIVRLDVGFRPEGVLPFTAIADQREEIDAAQNAILNALRGLLHTVVRQYETIPLLALEVGPASLRALETLASLGLVAQVVEDRLLAPTLAQSTQVVGTENAWNAGLDGTGMVIAVLDSGVDKTHPFLSGKVVEEACFSGNRSCPNGSRFRRRCTLHLCG